MKRLNKKNIVLVIGLVLLFWVSYIFSFSRALGVYTKYQDLQKEQVQLAKLPQTIIKLKEERNYIDGLLKKQQFSSKRSFQNNLLNYISNYSKDNQLKIISFKEPHVFNKDQGVIKTYSITIQGDYKAIIKLIHSLEKQHTFGNILNVVFLKKKQRRTNKSYLEATVLLQHVERSVE